MHPKYFSVVCTDTWPRRNWISSNSPPESWQNRAHDLLRSCGASLETPSFPAYSFTTCQTTFSVIFAPQTTPVRQTQRSACEQGRECQRRISLSSPRRLRLRLDASDERVAPGTLPSPRRVRPAFPPYDLPTPLAAKDRAAPASSGNRRGGSRERRDHRAVIHCRDFCRDSRGILGERGGTRGNVREDRNSDERKALREKPMSARETVSGIKKLVLISGFEVRVLPQRFDSKMTPIGARRKRKRHQSPRIRRLEFDFHTVPPSQLAEQRLCKRRELLPAPRPSAGLLLHCSHWDKTWDNQDG